MVRAVQFTHDDESEVFREERGIIQMAIELLMRLLFPAVVCMP